MILTSGMNQPIAPQAFAETAPLFFDGYFVGTQGLQLETRFASYASLYLTQPWVAAVVDKIAAAIARLGIKVWDTTPETGNILMTDSPYAKLMANPGATIDPYGFWQWVVSTIEIYGEAYLLKVKDDRDRTAGFIPMHPAMTQTFRDQFGDVAYWFMGQPNELMSQDMVVPFLRYNPNMTQRGVSRLEPLRSTLMNEDSTRRGIQAWWKNMGRPSGVINVEGKLNRLGKERLIESWQQRYSGSENIGGTPVLENGTRFEPFQMNAEEMQYIESRKINREEICGCFDIPPPAVHILDRATFSNITEQMRSMYRDTVMPRLEFIESIINQYVGLEFGSKEKMKFDIADVMRGDFETRSDSYSKLVQSGIAKPSEARPHFDLNDAGPVADQLYAQQQIQPLGAPAPSAPGAPGLPAPRALTSAGPKVNEERAKAYRPESDYVLAYLIRHGATTMSPAPEGWKPVPLSSEGVRDAQEGASALQRYLHDGWPMPKRVVSSDLVRATETAEIVAGQVPGLADLPFRTDEDIRAYDTAETVDEYEERTGRGLAAILEEQPPTLIVAHRSTTAYLDEHYVHHNDRGRAPDYEHDSLLHLGGLLAITTGGIIPLFKAAATRPVDGGAEIGTETT